MIRRGLSRFSSSSPATEEVGVELVSEGRVAIVRMNRPARMNSMSFGMGAKILEIFAQDGSGLPDSARAVVLTGAGERAFSTGRDLKDSKTHSEEDAYNYMCLCRDTVLAVRKSPIPTIAAINGFAFGWGMEISLGCDLRVVRTDAVLCFPECGLGIFPGAMGTVLLPRLVGAAVAKDLILTSRKFDGKHAFKIRLANRVEEGASETVNGAVNLATQIASNAPLGVRGAKKVIDDGLDMTFEKHAALSDKHRFPLNNTDDFREGLRAFAEKRTPEFRGH